MRKLMSVMVVISGLALGCGSDGGKADNNATDNSSGNNTGGSSGDSTGIDIPDDMSGGGEKYPECKVRADIPETFPRYMGEKPKMTYEQFMACQNACKDATDDSCFKNETNCPGFETLWACLSTEILGCSGASSGNCRSEYEDVECCAEANKCAPSDDACFEKNCLPDLETFQSCGFMDRKCAPNAQPCFATPATGTMMSATSATSATAMQLQHAHALRTIQMLRSAR